MTFLIQYVLSLPFLVLNINTIQIASKALLGLSQPAIIHIPPHVLYYEYLSFTVDENIKEVHIHSEWFEAPIDSFEFTNSTKVYYYGSKIQENNIISSGSPEIYVSSKYLSNTFSSIQVTHLAHFPRIQIPTCKTSTFLNHFNLFLVTFLWK